MTTRRGGGHPHVPDTVRHYPITTVYVVIAIAVVLALLLWGRLGGPDLSVCAVQAVLTQGEHR